MKVQDMHYDIKSKLNKIDSQQYKNLRIPEIDRLLNEACMIFIKLVAEPRANSFLGFETSQRSTDDIRTLVKTQELTNSSLDTGVKIGDKLKIWSYELPEDYMFHVRTRATINKLSCGDREAVIRIQQHDDEFEESTFNDSSYEWREVNALFRGNALKVYANDFTIKKIKLNYIKKPAYIHFAAGFQPNGTYNLPSGETLTGTQDCELPDHTHPEIVDIAVLLATDSLQIPDFQIKQAKLNLNQIN